MRIETTWMQCACVQHTCICSRPMRCLCTVTASVGLLFFMLLGGFCYFDARHRFLRVNALSLKPTPISLWLEGPYGATAAACDALGASNRFHPMQTKAMRRGGVEAYAWVSPAERPGGVALWLAEDSDDGQGGLLTWDNGAMVFQTASGSLFYRVRPGRGSGSSASAGRRAAGGAGMAITAALRSLGLSYATAAAAAVDLQQDLAEERTGSLAKWLRSYGIMIVAYYMLGCVAYGWLEDFGVLDTCYFLTTTATTVG